MLNRPHFIFINPKTTTVKQIKISLLKFGIGLFLFFVFIGISVKISVDLGIKFNHNSKIDNLQTENTILQQQLKIMDEKVILIRNYIDQIEELDDKIRARLDVPLIDEDVRQVGIGGSDISNVSGLKLEDLKLQSVILNNQNTLARLEREIKLENESFKKLLSIMERKEDSLRYLPAIKPVGSGRLTDSFGRRRHPIYKRIMDHHGIDLAANRGTPVYASGDGYVTFTGKNGGYGLFVSINHKYGFETKYGHLQKIYVRRGQFVKRGDKIGEVGNTGISTAPHLHYEVHYKNKPVNPTDYYFTDIKFE
jgi:murein DD-endopeptidase MepM/ murein hydrolase activator NlpD